MRSIFILFMTGLVLSCSKDDLNKDLPECVQAFVSDTLDPRPIMNVQVQKVGRNLHYLLYTGFSALDGTEQIVSESCDTLCFIGGFGNPICQDDYDIDAWETIWVR